MPANRFATDRIAPGQDQDARVLDRILQAILGRWPISKCDIASVFSAAIDWSDWATVPTENINVEEIFNNATGIAAALGCMHYRQGLIVNYSDPETLEISAGGIIHRGDFKLWECNVDGECQTVRPDAIIDTTECAPSEGNPSGLDSDMWYYIYVNMTAAGTTPLAQELFRISATPPVQCEGKGLEHPTNVDWAFIGSIRTMDTGEIRPFDRRDDGWVFWRTASAASDYQAAGYGNAGTPIGNSTGSWVRYERIPTGSDYHDGDKHIPPSANICRVATNDDSDSPGDEIKVRPINDAGEGYTTKGNTVTTFFISNISTPSQLCFDVPVNPCNADDVDKQTFFWYNQGGDEQLDVTAYHEAI